MADEDVVGLLKGLDPRKVGRDRFAALLAEMDRQAADGGAVDLSDLDAATFARLITGASADQLNGVLARPEPRTRVLDEITAHPADFLRLITRNVSGPVLFMAGKLKVDGDLGFAAGLTSLFDLPRG
ncbi:MAG TPA: SCP2 sterol-binding domain-containing protein [Pseudonocardiaceae bacterium]|nr:SCP2 sterol-binding domain-containing protein [Pseudonocardiaceae bacterium]